MKIELIVCDRCGKELQRDIIIKDFPAAIKIKRPKITSIPDFCNSCEKEFNKFMKRGK